MKTLKYTYERKTLFDYKKQNTFTEFVLFVDGCETDIKVKGDRLKAEWAFVKKINKLGIQLDPQMIQQAQ